MEFKAKVFKLGNSTAIYIPKRVYSLLEVNKIYTFEVKELKEFKNIPTYCELKHKGNMVYARKCGCY